MRLMEKASAYSLTEAQDAWIIFDTRRADSRVWNYVLTSGTATIAFEGRIADGAWITLDTLTASENGVMVVYPQMRARFTAASSFVGFIDLDADGRKLAGFSADRTDS